LNVSQKDSKQGRILSLSNCIMNDEIWLQTGKTLPMEARKVYIEVYLKILAQPEKAIFKEIRKGK
jgi:hypothetical protein